jgi:putative acetyltransferase
MILKKITIREYKAEDAQDLAKIYYNTIHKVNIRDYTQEQVNVWAPESSLEVTGWAKKFERTKPFVATVDNTIVGFAEFELDGHIDCFYCHHQWIGHGIGSALMNAIYEKARQEKIPRIFVDVSITARPFFEKQGFITTKEQTVVIKDVQLTNYKMENNSIQRI